MKRLRSNSQSPNKAGPKNKASSQTTSLYTYNNGSFKNRNFSYSVISPASRALRNFELILELLEALRYAIKAYKSLYIDGKILYKDISENNIIITDPKDTNSFTGILIDTELSKESSSIRSGIRHQTGIIEFIAIQVL